MLRLAVIVHVDGGAWPIARGKQEQCDRNRGTVYDERGGGGAGRHVVPSMDGGRRRSHANFLFHSAIVLCYCF